MLLVVGTFMNQHGAGAFPSYNTLAKASSLNRGTVIKHVREAEAAGWLRVQARHDREGERDSNHYEIAFPSEVVAQNNHQVVHQNNHVVVKTNQGGRAKQPRVVVQDDPNTPVLTPQRTQKGDAPVRVSIERLIEDGVTPETARDFLAHRKTKKAPLTERAWAGIKSEAAKAGWTLEQALDKTIKRNWIAFEAAWVAKEVAAAGGQVQANDSEWYEAASGWEAKAEELKVPRKTGEQFFWFKCRVAKAAGPGKWRDLILADLARTKSQHYAQVYEFFNGNPPMENAA